MEVMENTLKNNNIILWATARRDTDASQVVLQSPTPYLCGLLLGKI
jgi:hypothetical protein